MKKRPGTRVDSMVLESSSAVETPPAVTSALAKPSVPAGVRLQVWMLCSNWARVAFERLRASPLGRCSSSQRSASRAGRCARSAEASALISRRDSDAVSGAVMLAPGARSSWIGLAGLPVGRDLQDGRAAEPAVREKQLFAEVGR